MAGVSVIHNPLDPTETLLFYCSDYGQVSLERWRESSNTPDVGSNLTYDEPLPADAKVAESKKGTIKNPASFASVTYKNILWVFGIRTDNKICVISPEFAPLKKPPSTSFPGLAVCGDAQNAWLYYIADESPPCVKEYRFDPGISADFKYKYGPAAGTKLCAYCIGSKRYCIYQDDKNLMIFNASSGTDSKEIKNTNPKSKTPMAICVARGNVYLYFSNSDNRLVRIVRRGDEWDPSAEVKGALPLEQGSQIAVTTTADGKENMVFYIVKGDQRYSKFMDKIEKQKLDD